jgi:fatty acid desaturase
MMFARGTVMLRRDWADVIDLLMTLSFATAQVAVIIAVNFELNEQFSVATILLNILLAMIVPFLVFNWLVGYVSFLNHTHPRVPWFAKAEEWSFCTGQVRCSVHMAVPRWLIFFITDLGLHAAHHIEPRIPIWKLDAAQRHLGPALGDAVFERWSVRVQAAIFSRCKLYDYDNHVWLDFAGKPTTAPIIQSSTTVPEFWRREA